MNTDDLRRVLDVVIAQHGKMEVYCGRSPVAGVVVLPEKTMHPSAVDSPRKILMVIGKGADNDHPLIRGLR